MNEKYWERFEESGKIADYLAYKETQTCETAAGRYQNRNRKDEESESGNYRDRDGSVSSADWGI